MKKKRPIYMYQCVGKCKRYMYTENTFLKCCGRLTQWINGIEGKGVDMDSPKVKIKVSGYLEMSQENLDRLMTHSDPHTGLVYSIHMGYCDASHIDFDVPE